MSVFGSLVDVEHGYHGENREEGILYNGDCAIIRFFAKRVPKVGSRGPWIVDAGFPLKAKVTADISCIDEGTAAFLSGMVLMLRPRMILETGTHRGRSTKALVSALNETGQGSIITIDKENFNTLDMCLTHDEKTRLTQIVGESPAALEEEPFKSIAPIDMAFLDGGHTGDVLKAELDFVNSHRDKSCWVIVDNTTDKMWPEVRETLDNYNTYPRVTFESMCGIDVIHMHD